MAALTQIGVPALGASAPEPVSPLVGQDVLDADDQTPEQIATRKGIQVTKRALKRIRIAMAKENITPDQGGLRVGIQGGGCSGLSYNIRFDTQPRDRDRVYAFAQTHLDPETTDAPPIRIFVDPKSFIYLHGMVLDYEETLMRQAFNFINPHSTKSCGCGSSFST